MHESEFLKNEFLGKTVVVTGGSRGIGFAVTRHFRTSGANVVITARKADGLAEASRALEKSEGPGSIMTTVANAGDPDEAERVMTEIVEQFGRVDVLVNNAATNPYYGPLIHLDKPRAEKSVSVNQYGMLPWIRHAYEKSMQEHGGVVVNVSSIGAQIVNPGIGWYNATKAAMDHLTRQLSWELGPQVRVNGVAPSLVKTELARAVWEKQEVSLAAELPLRRLGEPEDIADAVLFLASSRASWITGHTLVVDGGALAMPPRTAE